MFVNKKELALAMYLNYLKKNFDPTLEVVLTLKK